MNIDISTYNELKNIYIKHIMNLQNGYPVSQKQYLEC